MFTAKVSFRILREGEDESQNNAVYSLLAAYLHDGRILNDDYFVIKIDGYFISFVSIPDADAFGHGNYGKYVLDDLSKLRENGLSQPSFEILGQDTERAEPCSCNESSAYILFTNYLSNHSPLKCFDCGSPIPLYRLPKFPSETYKYALGWQDEYKACDLLQMHSGFGERFGTKQMSDPHSGLSKTGLDICKEIKELSNKPVYYYLYRASGKSLKKERERKCPLCDGDWILDEELHNLFDFKCDKDYLLSNIAFSLK